ncbi:MAG: hypothetical protein ACI4T1_01935 [Christensenellales bacterium]
MQNVNNENLIKISEFLNSVDGLIDGKFILADIKISNLLKMIASNPSLYEYIKKCLIDFSFEKELSRAEVKNRFNNGEFNLPTEKYKIVAFVFCLLVECDAKRMDFYGFINENFKTKDGRSEYSYFSQKVLVPFKQIIIDEFYNNKEDDEENVKEDDEQDSTPNEDIFELIKTPLKEMVDNIALDRKIKNVDKESLNYIINNIIYSMKYKDLNIVNAFISVLDILSKKISSIRSPLNDIKTILLNYYS